MPGRRRDRAFRSWTIRLERMETDFRPTDRPTATSFQLHFPPQGGSGFEEIENEVSTALRRASASLDISEGSLASRPSSGFFRQPRLECDS